MGILQRLKHKSRGFSISLSNIITMAVGLLLLGLLWPVAIEQLESYTPTNATLATIWPFIAIFAVLAVGISYIKSATD